jgi:translation initiation factor IF-1
MMAKEELLQFEGIIMEVLPEARFRVRLANDHIIVAYTAGRRGRNPARPAANTPPRFKVGDIVAVNDAAGDLLPKHEKRELLEARFEITRQRPDRRQRFQYRIKNTVTGQERAVTETGLREASSFSASMAEELRGTSNCGEPDSIIDTPHNVGSDEPLSGCEHADARIDDATISRSLDDNKLSFPKVARPAPARPR